MGEYIAVPDWLKPGAPVAVKRGAGGGYAYDTVERLTPTQIVMASGDRYGRATLKAVKRGYWGTPELVPTNHPGVIEQAKNQAVESLWSPLQEAMVSWRQGAHDEPAREEALDAVRRIMGDTLAKLHKIGSITPYEEKP